MEISLKPSKKNRTTTKKETRAQKYFDENTQGIYTQTTTTTTKSIYAQVKLRQSKVIWTKVKEKKKQRKTFAKTSSPICVLYTAT